MPCTDKRKYENTLRHLFDAPAKKELEKLLQDTSQIHIVHDLLLNQILVDDLILSEPMRYLVICFFDGTGSMYQVSDSALIVIAHLI